MRVVCLSMCVVFSSSVTNLSGQFLCEKKMVKCTKFKNLTQQLGMLCFSYLLWHGSYYSAKNYICQPVDLLLLCTHSRIVCLFYAVCSFCYISFSFLCTCWCLACVRCFVWLCTNIELFVCLVVTMSKSGHETRLFSF